VPFRRARDELLGRTGSECGEAIDSQLREKAQAVPAAHGEAVHVIALIVQGDGLAPGALLVPPGRELGPHGISGHHLGVDRERVLRRVAEESVDYVLTGLENALQRLGSAHAVVHRLPNGSGRM
jgi:hypothetical protein